MSAEVKTTGKETPKYREVKAISKETFVVLAAFILLFGYLGYVMGFDKVFSIAMKTGFDVLINTSFYIMAVAILAGACAGLMSEFGIIALINRIISPIMRPPFRIFLVSMIFFPPVSIR